MTIPERIAPKLASIKQATQRLNAKSDEMNARLRAVEESLIGVPDDEFIWNMPDGGGFIRWDGERLMYREYSATVLETPVLQCGRYVRAMVLESVDTFLSDWNANLDRWLTEAEKVIP